MLRRAIVISLRKVQITVYMQYYLRKEELPLLHNQFDLYYEDVMQSSSIDAFKGAIPIYTTRQLINNRTDVERTLYKAVSQRLGGTCCRPDCGSYPMACPTGCTPVERCSDEEKGLNVDVKFFHLAGISIPSDVSNRFMQALLLQEDALKEELLQQAQVTRKKTSGDVAQIKNEAIEISANATAYADYVSTVAQANYTARIVGARSQGLKALYSNLGINQQDHKNSFDYLRTIRELENAHFTVDFQQRIAGNL